MDRHTIIAHYPEFVIAFEHVYVMVNGKKEFITLYREDNVYNDVLIKRYISQGDISLNKYIEHLLSQKPYFGHTNWEGFIEPFLSFLERQSNGRQLFMLFYITGKKLLDTTETTEVKEELLGHIQRIYTTYTDELKQMFMDRIRMMIKK